MPFKIECPACKQKLSARDDLKGRTVKCPSCQANFTVGANGEQTKQPTASRVAAPANGSLSSHISSDAKPETAASHEVFISHSTKDKAAADEIVAALEKAGIRCWIASRALHASQSWAGAIVDAIRTSRVMVVVYSSHANESRHVLNEVERAVANNLALVPIRLEDAPMRNDLELFLSSVQWIDALDGHLQELLPELARLVTALIQSSPFVPHAAMQKRLKRRLTIRFAAVSLIIAIGLLGLIVWKMFYNESQVRRGKVMVQIEELITHQIAPESWEVNRGHGQMNAIGETMTVNTNQDIQWKIQAFLNDRRKDFGLPPQFARSREPLEASIEERLDQDLPSALEYTDADLQDVVMSLQDKWKMPILLNKAALEEKGIGTDSPVNVVLSGPNLSCRKALLLMLKNLQLTYVIQDSVLIITTNDDAEKNLTARTYDLSDLIDAWASSRAALNGT
jgi:hypothetical protein